MKYLPLGTDGTGAQEFFGIDEYTGQIVIKRDYDVSTVLDENKRRQNLNDGYSPTRDLQHVASIPVGVIQLWIQKYGVDPTSKGHEVLLARLLNDPDWRWLRTGSGQLDFKES
jgi:hypothetical protein